MSIYTYELKRGDRGYPVRELQKRLNKRLGCGLGVDGILGPKTLEAAWACNRTSSDALMPAGFKLTQDALANCGLKIVLCADLSGHNEQGPKDRVDIAKMKAAGVGALYLKMTEGTTYVNEEALRQASEARKHGLLVGGYHYGQPARGYEKKLSPEESGRAEALHYLETTRHLIGLGVNLVHAYDLESGVEKDKTADEDEFNARHVAAVLDVWDADRTITVGMPFGDIQSGVYTAGWAENLYFERAAPATQARLARRPLWLASYNSGVDAARWPDLWSGWFAWQFTGKGKIDGVRGNVDLSWMILPT